MTEISVAQPRASLRGPQGADFGSRRCQGDAAGHPPHRRGGAYPGAQSGGPGRRRLARCGCSPALPCPDCSAGRSTSPVTCAPHSAHADLARHELLTTALFVFGVIASARLLHDGRQLSVGVGEPEGGVPLPARLLPTASTSVVRLPRPDAFGRSDHPRHARSRRRASVHPERHDDGAHTGAAARDRRLADDRRRPDDGGHRPRLHADGGRGPGAHGLSAAGDLAASPAVDEHPDPDHGGEPPGHPGGARLRRQGLRDGQVRPGRQRRPGLFLPAHRAAFSRRLGDDAQLLCLDGRPAVGRRPPGRGRDHDRRPADRVPGST